MRRGVRFAIDVGQARIGVAKSDPDGILATPVETLARQWTPASETPSSDVEALARLDSENSPIEWLVGLPISLSGRDTASTEDARAFAHALANRLSTPVRLIDERLSTVSAHGALREAGRKTRSHRPVVDQVAAVILLQHVLDAERAGHLLGSVVSRAHTQGES